VAADAGRLGYSPLNQISRSNVAQLKMAWTRGMAAGSTQESTPLVYDGVMYLPNSGDYIQALDARTGDMIWDYQRPLGQKCAARTESEYRDLRQHRH
jgi:alcohol dehydrogenase (cytochrome c)